MPIVDRRKLWAAIASSPEYRDYQKDVAEELIEEAKSIYMRQQDPTNEDKTTETTPPKYVESFGWDRHDNSLDWEVFNEDPNAMRVEFGTYKATSKSGVRLKYRPFGLAIDVLMNRVSE